MASKEPGCEPSPSAKLIPSADECLPNGGRWLKSMTTSPSADLSAERPMSSPQGSLAKTSRRQESAPALPAPVLASGNIWYEPFAWYDRDTQSWRTWQRCLDGEWELFSETWPNVGMTRNGIAWAPINLVRPSTENASGYWQTPTTRDYKGQSGLGNRTKRGKNGRLHVANLCDQIVDIGRPDLLRSPTFREWLMGLPIGHTVLRPSATPSSRKSRKSSGEQS